MKKMMTFLLAASMLAMSFASCGGGSSETEETSGSESTSNTIENTETTTAAETEEETAPAIPEHEWPNESLTINRPSDLHAEEVCTTPSFEIPALKIGGREGPFTLSPLLASDAILQAQMPVHMWGSYTGDAGNKMAIRVTHIETGIVDEYYAEITDGKFDTYIKAYPYSGPYKIELIDEEGKFTRLTGIYFGEVVFCCGQSNMGWAMNQCYDGTTEKLLYQDVIDNSQNDQIRYIGLWPRNSETPEDELAPNATTGWQKAGPRTTGGFTAVPYFYARELNARYGIHVGLVNANMGGTSVYTWMNPTEAETLNVDPKHTPSIWYNALIHPIRRMTGRTVIWYQGEGHYDGYADLLAAMIRGWRREFNNSEMLFGVVQLPRYVNERDYFLCREEQKKVCELVDNVTYSVNIDNGLYPQNKAEGDGLNNDGIHPYEKEPVGTRLANAVMQAFFGAPGVWRGPVVETAKVENGKIVLTFSNVGDGLVLRGLAGFKVAGADGQYKDAKPEIVGKDTVVLTCDEVAAPKSVHYGYSNYSNFQEKPVTSCSQSVCLYNTKDGTTDPAYPAEQFWLRNIDS